MSAVQVFKFDLTTSIRTAMVNENVWFLASDMAAALDYASPDKAYALCKQPAVLADVNRINDLHPSFKWIPESDMYRLIMRSTKPEAEKFQDWVCEEVLPTIRKTGNYSIPTPAQAQPSQIEMNLIFAEATARMFNLPESGKLLMMRKVEKEFNLIPMLPVYAVDAPTGTTNASSSLPTKAAKYLLIEHGKPFASGKFNILAESKGFLEQIERPSTKHEGVTKKFWCVTTKGLEYGKNVTSEHSPRETQPHWYINSFGVLLALLA